MNIMKLSEKLARKMKWYDFSLFKLAMMSTTLFMVTIWDSFRELVMDINPYCYLFFALLLFIPLFQKMFTK